MLTLQNGPLGLRRSLLRFATLLALPALLVTTSCKKDDKDDPAPTPPAQQNIVQIAAGNANFSTLVAAVQKTGLTATLSGTTELTVFAPVNAAFTALPDPYKTAASINAITAQADIDFLRNVLLYHVIAGDVKAAAITSGSRDTQRPAASGFNKIYLSKNATGVFINGTTRVTTADIDATNGVIHGIDKVLLPPTQNIVQIAQGNTNLTALVAAVLKTNLATTLSDAAANFTVFAPNNAAFGALPAPFNTAANISNISDQATIDALRNILLYHAAAARVFSPDLTNNQTVNTAAAAPNNTVIITTTGGAKVKGIANQTASNIATTDILATNGVIHLIDQVLLPSAPGPQNIVQIAANNPDFSALVAAVQKTGLTSTLSGTTQLTVFAPGNAAFSALPNPYKTAASINAITSQSEIDFLRNVLLYHVLGGRVNAAAITSGSRDTQLPASAGFNKIFLTKNASGVFINGSTQVTTADIDASNGVIHAINKVLLPPTQNIVQIAQGNTNLTALVAAVVKTGLVNTLSNATANFTVFAPTDAAFAALPAPFNTAASISNISDPATISTLQNILLYHAAAARVFSTDLTNNQSVTTAAATPNNTLLITTTGGAKVKGLANSAPSNITATDVLATNGVIHLIDQVLLPN